MLVHPDTHAQVSATLERLAGADAGTRLALEVMRTQPSAVWIDSKAKLYGPEGSATVQGALASAARRREGTAGRAGQAPLVVLVLYNLPNRDCAALASAGEICCVYAADGRRCNLLAQDMGCKHGMWEYREQFVRPFARLLAQHASREGKEAL